MEGRQNVNGSKIQSYFPHLQTFSVATRFEYQLKRVEKWKKILLHVLDNRRNKRQFNDQELNQTIGERRETSKFFQF